MVDRGVRDIKGESGLCEIVSNQINKKKDRKYTIPGNSRNKNVTEIDQIKK